MQMTLHLNAAMVTHACVAFPKPAYKLTSARQQCCISVLHFSSAGQAVMQYLFVAAGQAALHGAVVVCLHHTVSFSLTPLLNQFNGLTWAASLTWHEDVGPGCNIPLLCLCLLFAAHSLRANSATRCSCHMMQERLEPYSLHWCRL